MSLPRLPDGWPVFAQPVDRTHLGLTLIWLVAGPGLLFPAVWPGLSALLLLLLAGGWLFHWRRSGALALTPLDGAAIVYVGFYALGYLQSPVPEISLPKLLAATWGLFAYLLARHWLRGASQRRRLPPLMALAGAGIALLSPFALAKPATYLVNVGLLLDRLPHLTGTFYLNRNELAGTLLLLLPFGWWWWRDARVRPRVGERGLASATLVLILGGLFLTQSRNVVLATAVAALTWWLWPRLVARWVILAALTAATPLLWILATAAADRPAIAAEARALDAQSTRGWADDTSFVTRLEMWRNAGAITADYPAGGAGLYAFEPISWGWYGYDTVSPRLGLIHAHNLWLQTAATLGLSGLLALILLWGLALRALWRATGMMPPLLAASAFAYHTFNLFDVLSLGQKPAILIWLVLAGIAAVGGASWHPGRLARLLPAAPLLLMLLLLLTPAGRRERTWRQLDAARWHDGDLPAVPATDDRRLGLARLLAGDETGAMAAWVRDPAGALFLRNQGQVADRAGAYETAFAWYARALTLAPTDYAIYYWRSLTHERAGALEAARQDAVQAVALLPTSAPASAQAPVLFQWGRMLAAADQWAAAQTAFQRLVGLDPTNPLYHLWLARAYIQLGDAAAADAAFATAITHGHDPAVRP